MVSRTESPLTFVSSGGSLPVRFAELSGEFYNLIWNGTRSRSVAVWVSALGGRWRGGGDPPLPVMP